MPGSYQKEPFIRFSHIWVLLSKYLLEYRRAFKALIMADIFERFFFFIAFGFGLGRAVKEMGGVDYLSFIAPGVVAGSCMFVMVMAMSYGVYERSKEGTGVWSAYLATPLKLQEILLVEMTYASIRSMGPAIIMYAASYGLGAQLNLLGVFLGLVILFLSNYVYGALTLSIGVHIRRILYFSYMRGLFMMPMYLFSGIFFDLSAVPSWMSIFAHFYPLTYVVEVVRLLSLGQSVDWGVAVVDLCVLLCLFCGVFAYAFHAYKKRIFVWCFSLFFLFYDVIY